ncbi:hypothetical protein [Robertmurraya massiliosenegalensis]|uniref:hypothetical protein n=1 Tax=Robertmurraya massiliosenegalensis TaxID=1287657 RepID=UPI00030BCB46|nr:hypothetical protein [Robertmurraya massiliosenegalensis]
MSKKSTILFILLFAVGGLLQGCGNTSAHTLSSDLLYTEKILPTNFYSMSEQGVLVYKVTNQSDFDELWKHFRLTNDPTNIDWNEQTAIFLGIIESSSCPLQFKTAQLNDQKTEVMVYLDGTSGKACTDDATPRTMVIAMDAVEMDNVSVLKIEDYFGINPIVEFHNMTVSNEDIY